MAVYFVFTSLLNLALGFAAAMYLLRWHASHEAQHGSCEELIVESPLTSVAQPMQIRVETPIRATSEAVEIDDRPIVQWQVEPTPAHNEPALAAG